MKRGPLANHMPFVLGSKFINLLRHATELEDFESSSSRDTVGSLWIIRRISNLACINSCDNLFGRRI